MAASFILIALVWGLDAAKKMFKEKVNIVCCSLGVFIYAGTGLVALLYSANFLDYSGWRHIFHSSDVMARYYGIALVELGVQLVVTGVMYSIFFDLALASRYSKDRWGE